jgi:threonine/homoserine/homoserine lactone efflux protein
MTLGEAIAEILPLAMGIALFPIPIITVLLLLSSRHARTNAAAFMVAWILGLAALISIFSLMAETAGADSDRGTSTLVSGIKLLLGAALLFIAFREWQRRPASGQDPEMPGWMRNIDGFTTGKAFRTGLLLSAASPKNLVLVAAAGSTAAQMGPGSAEMVVVVVVFTTLSSMTIAGPVLYFLLGGARAMRQMEKTQRWLIRHNATVVSAILLILGAVLTGNAIRGLAADS